MRRHSRFGLWACLLAIILLSLLPGDMRPQSPAPGELEHFMAYFGAGLLIAMRYPSPKLRLIFWAATAMLSCILEILQQFVPGRVPEANDSLVSSFGLTIGLLLAAALLDHHRA
jgi:VanZ family protein